MSEQPRVISVVGTRDHVRQNFFVESSERLPDTIFPTIGLGRREHRRRLLKYPGGGECEAGLLEAGVIFRRNYRALGREVRRAIQTNQFAFAARSTFCGKNKNKNLAIL